jgi:hypothetical protein
VLRYAMISTVRDFFYIPTRKLYFPSNSTSPHQRGLVIDRWADIAIEQV